ncbi:B3GNT1, Beta-1,3-N-acetylGucosamiNylTransferase 1, homolog [Caenorhabditis elegans]|uniref:B3GNT1, Beta-1,3-N-acetylGucosamiNylTransferase 1, homolog n=1 Tax=Caenorhabditis elegans TaxID=6239 RepID=O45584_CAEEL|nr:B3GNT1, Beta-1,3-N-acetylGucosamiNylTransferase 1, homolog [Caenorhabditis elegans]CAB04495.1 B3GNT1, Beta-1,3-N-acetylGucosamiNylTransferase 1, homolog [Caenorhabditis elegans]|eukprot:NP_493107.1 B3GNT1, Beta-1,3-N-acetylGucosamiNylTransferase 1, homolog [Caenorhabditis elegans]
MLKISSRFTPFALFLLFSILLCLWFLKKYSQDLSRISIELYENEFCIGYNFLEATEKFREDGLEPVTLAIHGTSDVLEVVEKKPSNWDGPISFGMFVDYHSQKALEYVAMLHQCDKEFGEKVTVHYVFRTSPSQMDCPVITPDVSVNCDEFRRNRKQLLKEITSPFQIYPINLMRNVARRGATSDLHLIVDADMTMSSDFARKVKPIANRIIDGKQRQVLVVRRFETNEDEIPLEVEQLKMGFENQKVFEFHHNFFFIGHKIPDVEKWFHASKTENEVTAWEIPYSGNAWEVQVILHRNDMYNAEYFPSRIRDMQSLIYGLCRANYTFNLLSHVFNVHQGIKEDDTMYSKVVTAHSKRYGRNRAFSRYVHEMNTAYPGTIQRCGKFEM